ncbi:MAG: DUF349 domain-containing protein [Bacteroidetes bacterium]|nr:DUF349 domain-containing protein [Bacteroidota bacterium]
MTFTIFEETTCTPALSNDKVFISHTMEQNAKEQKPVSDKELLNGQEDHAGIINTEENHDPQDELQQAEDYSGLGKADLLKKMEELLAATDHDAVKLNADKVKELFQEMVKEETEAKHRAWLETKEDEDDKFEPATDPLVSKFDELIRKFNNRRIEIRKQKEAVQRKNLAAKLELVDELKALAETSESMHKAFDKLQLLQHRWRETGTVPQSNVEELRKNWQHHLDRFYDVVKISRELRELDHKKNHELKIEIISKAEALDKEASVKRALNQLHELHENWREIGPAAKELNDQLWEKFKSASDKVHARRDTLLLESKAKHEENLKTKISLCEKMDAEAEKNYSSHKEWSNANDKTDALFEEWRKIGHVPKEDEGKTWKRFKEARLKFFRNRENYYGKLREEFKVNLVKKTALCEKAEALKTSTDWKNTATQFKKLQDEWKNTGPVSRKVSEKIWQRFKSAADAFFEGRNKQFAEADAKFKENSVAREALIAEANAADLGADLVSAREVIVSFQKKWNELPPPARNDREHLEKEWKKATDKMIAQLKEKGGDESILKRIHYDQLKQTERGKEQMHRERMNIQDKIKRLQGEINTLETNLGFFGKSKGAQSLVADYQNKVDAAKAEIEKLKAQLKMIPRDEKPEPEPEPKNFKGKKGFRPRF